MGVYAGYVRVDNGGQQTSDDIIKDGTGKNFLADDGEYKSLINDEAPDSEDTAYSAKHTEARLKDITNIIKASQDSKVNMWQKTTLNVTAGTPITYETDSDSSIDKVIVQCYKFVEGEDNVVKVLKEFNNSDEANFYHTEHVEFTQNDSSASIARIKKEYKLTNTINDDGLYESEVIDKDDYVILHSIEVVE